MSSLWGLPVYVCRNPKCAVHVQGWMADPPGWHSVNCPYCGRLCDPITPHR